MNIICGVVLFVLLQLFNINEAVVLKIKDGKIRGVTLLSRSNRYYNAFKGIPFAKPPIGNLRFKDPQRPIPWGNNILNTTEDAPKCIQKNYFGFFDPPVEGSEDCLYLNVYTPKLDKNCDQKLPVMVYIFYGGFLAGSGRSDHAGPDYLMDQDIVFVSINYRLNVFGFLSFGNDDAAGNWGFKDQAFALKWIQENIRVFGGNKDQVTIFGDSAGAGSVHLHMFSPLSKGLFHRGISQSGSALTFWARPHNSLQIENARRQAGFVGCNPNDSPKNIIFCLRSIPADVLADSTKHFKVVLAEPTVTFAAVIEKRTPLNPNPFLVGDPYNLLRSGSFNAVPWICGVAEEEGLVRSGYILRNNAYKSIFVTNLEQNLPLTLALILSITTNAIPLAYNRLVNFYLQNDTDIATLEGVEGLTDMFSDRFMVYGTYQSSLLQSMKMKAPVWVYRYNYKSQLTYSDYFSYTSNPVNGTLGVCHVDDLIPLFYSPAIFNQSLSSLTDLVMSYTMVQMWTTFATNGNPSPNNMFVKFNWEPLTALYGRNQVNISDLRYLYIEGPNSDSDNPIKFEMRNDFFVERMKFWDNLGMSDTPSEIV